MSEPKRVKAFKEDWIKRAVLAAEETYSREDLLRVVKQIAMGAAA